MHHINWNEKAKRLLKSELIRRGIASEKLVILLENIGVKETKSSIDSKISRGTFSAAFLIQCLNAIGCQNFIPGVDSEMNNISTPSVLYKLKKVKTGKHARS